MTTTTHATCEDCQRVMDPGVGCTFTHVSKGPGGKLIKRLFVGEGDDWSSPVCHDCNAGDGKPHHAGCDAERCPECGAQMLGCWGGDDDGELAELQGYAPCGWTHLMAAK